MRSIRRFVFALTLVSGVGLAVGCGDDDGGGGDDPDAAVDPDAEPEPDAMLPTIRSGTFGIFEAEITNPEGVALGLSGSDVSVGWDDLTTGDLVAEDLDGDGEPDSNIGGCAVTINNVGTSVERTPTNEGTVTVAGTANGDFDCSFDATEDDYVCVSTDANASGAVPVGTQATPLGNGSVAYTWGDANKVFPTNFRGMTLTIADGTFPNEPLANGTFPIIQRGDVGAENQLIVANPALEQVDTVTTAGTYSTTIGAIVPGGFAEFLGGDGDPVTINGPTGESGAIVQEFSTLSVCPNTGCEFDPNGEGLTLDSSNSVLPHQFPHFTGTAADVTYTCDSPGVCGDFDGGALNAVIVAIETTDTAPTVTGSPLDFADFPDPTSVGVTIQCGFIGETTGTVPAAAIQAMIDAHSGSAITRIKTQVLVVAGVVATNEDNQAVTPLFVGHAVAGFTDPP